jgi:hypothetical protein
MRRLALRGARAAPPVRSHLRRPMATAPRAQPEEPAGEEEQPLTRLEELRLRLQVEQEAMDLEEFVGTVDLDAAAVVVPRGRQREAKPSWLKHNALKKTDPTTVQGQNYLRLKKDVRREFSFAVVGVGLPRPAAPRRASPHIVRAVCRLAMPALLRCRVRPSLAR